LSARFSRAQFEQMNADVAVMVATDDERVAGYLCASSVAFNRQFPLLTAMIQRYDDVSFHGRLLAGQNTFVYGPVCIDRAERGHGVLRSLFGALRREVAGSFEAGVCFVAAGNARSLAAHEQGLQMQRVAEFEFQQRRYCILAFEVLPPMPELLPSGAVGRAAAVVYEAIAPTPQYAWPLLCKQLGTEIWVKHENHRDRRIQGAGAWSTSATGRRTRHSTRPRGPGRGPRCRRSRSPGAQPGSARERSSPTSRYRSGQRA
jgi:hypothetical protein